MMRKTLYILVGPQGSGKTYWATRTNLIRVSQDEQGKGGHYELFIKCLENGVSVIIDRMNFNRQQRERYIQPARKCGYHIILVWFNVDRETCLRRLATRKDHPTIAHDANHNNIIDTYFNQFESPRDYEYDEILTITDRKYCRILDLRNQCCNRRVIVVGDIHGCFDEFMNLLDKCEYSANDIVVATGDLVDRGPKIKETLLWFRSTLNAYTVLGNHEDKIRRYWIGNPVKIINGLDCTIEQCHCFEPIEWAMWLESLPQIIRLQNLKGKPVYVVHAGVYGRKPIEKQHIETCIYVRYCGGTDFFDDKNGTIWWQTLDGSYIIISGHVICENPRPCEYAYCLDGGAYKGIKLRSLVIDNDECEIFEVTGNKMMPN